MNDSQVAELASVFVRTCTSYDAEELRQAHAFLDAASKRPAYGTMVLKLVASESVPPEVRQAAAVNFKNHVRMHWLGSPADSITGPEVPAMPDAEKEQIRGLITSLMLSAPALVRAQLSEALVIISGHDFPARWKGLLPDLIERLGVHDALAVNGVLETFNSIFKRYRNQFMTEGLSNELEYCQQAVKPLLAALQRVTAALPAAAAPGGSPDALSTLLSSARLNCRVFYSLNSPGLTEEFEATLDAWMAEFHTLLTFEPPAEALPSGPAWPASRETPLDAVKSAVAANANLFMGMNEEEFAKYLQTFVQDVWVLLTKTTLQPRQDNLAMNAIRFLTTVARSVHHQLFRNEDALRQVCENIVIPNTRLRDDAEELFEWNWLEYARQDTEGSDADTRRRSACELVRALTEKFPAEVTQLFTGYVGSMLAEYAAAPAANWKAKDCAVYLVTALAARTRTAAAGATATNELVNIPDFYRTHIAPDLQAAGADKPQILLADALKFLTTFRAKIPKADALAAFPGIVRLLHSESNVVHSYAATCVERLLSTKDDGAPRFSVADLQAQLEPLLNGLFAAFKMPDSAENEYIMKCVMRLITFVGPQIAPVAPAALKELAAMLLEVCKNPTQPGFNHFLFESVAALVRHGAAADPGMLDALQEQLFPAFQVVLSEDVQEFHPYVFQIFAQLIELRSGALPPVYMQIFPPLLSPQFWERPGNVTPLVRLLQAYLEKAAGEVVSGGHLEGVLGVFQKLLASKAHDHEGFFILNSLMEFLPLDVFRGYLPTIWTLLFRRLESARTAKYQRGLVVFIAFFVTKHGGSAVLDSIDGLQPSPPLSDTILDSVWAPAVARVHGDTERRLVAAASARLLTEVPRLQEAGAAALWGRLLQGALAVLQQAGDGASPDAEVEDIEEFAGYTAAYAQLHNADRPERDPLPDVPDAGAFLAKQLGSLAAQRPGTLPARVATALPAPEQQAQLQALLQVAGMTLA